MFLKLQMKYGLQHIAKLKNLAFAKLLYYFCDNRKENEYP
jgi:hypothetical protein